MTVYVFLGPTLPIDEARSILGAVYLPPVRHGDVWRIAAFGQPSAIAIIDGFFEHVPSVWHKEILWAMNQGIPVFGASSMGALRAAELEQFGMVGIGRIFKAYRDAVLPPYTDQPFEDDDEVAVVHGPPESGYPSSEAMVNIRCTLAQATDERIIGQRTRDNLVGIAKSLFYKDRSYANLLKHASTKADFPQELAELRGWLPDGRIDQKREDALALLQHLRDTKLGPPNSQFRFEHTTMWEQVLSATAMDSVESTVLTELRLQGAAYTNARRHALDGLLATVEGSRPHSDTPEPRENPEAAADYIRELSQDETRNARVRLLIEPLADTVILGHLRNTGDYGHLLSRAQAKRDRLEQIGMFPPELSDVDETPEDLMAWLSTHLNQPLATDAAAWTSRLHFEDVSTFLRALAGEYLYVTRQ